MGVGASGPLIESARAEGDGRFLHVSYEELSDDPSRLGTADFGVAVCNFSLLGKAVEPLLMAVHSRLLVQMVHPLAAGEPCHDGWRTETFGDFEGDFEEAMPWYFRTFGSWVAVLRASGYAVERRLEPGHGERPLLLLLVGTPLGSEP